MRVAAAGGIPFVLLMRREAVPVVATKKDRRLLVAERADCDDSAEPSRPTRIGSSRGTVAEPGTKADEPPLEQRQKIKGRVDVARMVAFLNEDDDEDDECCRLDVCHAVLVRHGKRERSQRTKFDAN